jgi:hypothetical protein
MDATDKMNDPAILPAAIRNGEFVVKDSGQRTATSRRAPSATLRTGKGFFHCLPYEALEAAAKLYEAGAKKYGEGQLEEGDPAVALSGRAAAALAEAGERLEGRRPRRRRVLQRVRVHLDRREDQGGRAAAVAGRRGVDRMIYKMVEGALWLVASAMLFAANVVTFIGLCENVPVKVRGK